MQVATRYERVPYPSRPLASLHPERLAATARLLGLRPTPVERCRVLELGCADGAHLLPMAAQLPRSRFVGVDVAAPRIAAAREQAAALGLTNVSFELTALEGLGDGEPYDYVLAHGLYSWIEPPARDALLALCRRRLAPHGLALVSYNVFPGWHLRGLSRGLLRRFGTGNEVAGPGWMGGEGSREASAPGTTPAHGPIPARQGAQPGGAPDLQAGRRLVDWVARNAPGSAYAAVLQSEVGLLSEVSDSYLFHDHLAPLNDPVWFLDFVAHAAVHGLRYAAEARLVDMAPERFSADSRRAVAEAAEGDLLRSEQLMDLLEPRYFRRTLLCHAELRPQRRVEWRRVVSLRFALPPGTDDAAPWGYSAQWEETADSVRDALARRAPQSATFGELLGAVSRVKAPGARERLGRLLLTALAQGRVVAVTRRWPLAASAPERPRASPLARWQAAAGQGWVTNQRHEPVGVDAEDRLLLAALDGRRGRRSLTAMIARAGCQLAPPDIEARLGRFARNGLLV